MPVAVPLLAITPDPFCQAAALACFTAAALLLLVAAAGSRHRQRIRDRAERGAAQRGVTQLRPRPIRLPERTHR